MVAAELPEFLGRVLAAESLLAAGLYASAVGARRLAGPGGTAAARLTACAVVFLWGAAVLFNALLHAHAFRLGWVMAAAGVIAGIVRLRGPGFRATFAELASDCRIAVRGIRGLTRPQAVLAALAGAGLLLRAARPLYAPILGWDGITYHGPIAAMWVQEGAPLHQRAPGGWGSYQTFFLGAEVFYSFAMLPFHGEMGGALFESFAWLGIALPAVALAMATGQRAATAWCAAMFLLAVPTLQRSPSSWYVEPLMVQTHLAALLFAWRYARRRRGGDFVLATMAWGVCASIKLPMLAMALPSCAILAVALLWTRDSARRKARTLLAGAAIFAAVTAPGLVRNAIVSGYPLGQAPMRIAGIALGDPDSYLAWYTFRPDELPAETWKDRAVLLDRVFRLARGQREALCLATIAPLLLLVPACVRRTPPSIAITVLGGSGIVLALVWGSSFDTLRLLWAQTVARFLLPIAAPAVAIAGGLLRRRRAALAWRWYLLASAVWMVARSTDGVVRVEYAAASAVLGGIALAGALATRVPARWRFAASVALPLALLPPLQVARDALRFRLPLVAHPQHELNNYWFSCAPLAEIPGKHLRIAIASGNWRNHDNWFVHYFLGSRLQNEIEYVPPTCEGSIVEFGPDYDARIERDADAATWIRRLRERGVTHVMSFGPPGIEARWMQARPVQFRFLAGSPGEHGLYELRESR